MAATRQNSEDTRRRLLDAADVVLRERGYGGTSARVIAAEAGVNSALVFYHFGGVDPLLLAALDRSSEARMAMHRRTVEGVRTVEELVAAAKQIYLTDLERGYLAQFSEIVAAAVTKPELREAITARADPWVRFVEESLGARRGRHPARPAAARARGRQRCDHVLSRGEPVLGDRPRPVPYGGGLRARRPDRTAREAPHDAPAGPVADLSQGLRWPVPGPIRGQDADHPHRHPRPPAPRTPARPRAAGARSRRGRRAAGPPGARRG